jgi:dienelactone hydrolase
VIRRALLVVAVLWLAGCGGSSPHATIAASPRSALLDSPPRIRVTGGDEGAVVRASVVDGRGRRWTSTTRLADLRRDPARPPWTLRHGRDFLLEPASRLDVRLDVVEGGHAVAHATMARLSFAPGVREEPVRAGLYGDLFAPAEGGRGAAALVIGGSDGGLTTSGEAALLASHGYPAMALAYFRSPGLPDELEDIPLEYFARALRRLRARSDVDPRRVAVIGVSRGGEAALLIGATYPRLVHGVVALVPSNVVNPSLDGASAAWTLRGRPVAHVTAREHGDAQPTRTPDAVIPAERIAGPIHTASGDNDALWPSWSYAETLHRRLDAHGFRYPQRDLSFDDAGHALGAAVPYQPTATVPQLGGSAAADEAAKAALWPRILAVMTGLRGG